MTDDIELMIIELVELRDNVGDIERALWSAREKVTAKREELLAAMMKVNGRKVGDILTAQDGKEYRISGIYLSATNELYARCYDKTQAGKWSTRPRANVRLKVGEPA